MLVVGWDVSSSVIGVCAIDADTGKTHRYWAIVVKGNTLFQKYESAIAQIDVILKELTTFPLRHFVEDRLANYTAGRTMRQTILVLTAMNAVVSRHLNLNAPVVHIPPVTAKRICGLKVPKGGDKKEEAIKMVRSLDIRFPYSETKFGNPGVGVGDMADAWLLATSGMKLLKGEATLAEGKKARGAKQVPRPSKAKVPRKKRVPVPVPKEELPE